MFIRYLNMPKKIVDRVSDYFDYLLARNHPGSDGMLAVSQLPSSMFRDISSRMYEDHVKKVRHPDGLCHSISYITCKL